MKKLICAISAFMVLNLSSYAQDTKKSAVKETKAAKKEVKSMSKTDEKAMTGKHLKKDGTPDMRYKENKAPKK